MKRKKLILKFCLIIILIGASVIGFAFSRKSLHFASFIDNSKTTTNIKTENPKKVKAKKPQKEESKPVIDEEKLKSSLNDMVSKSIKIVNASKESTAKKAKEKAPKAPKEKVYTIVLDPGHGGFGGTHPGCQYNGLTEKDLTLKVAYVIKANLEQYDNIKVILTRDSDYDVSLEDRAKIAKKNKADFLFSIHFNASGGHMPFGSEQWIPVGQTQKESYAMAANVRDAMASLGLFQKGIKSRQNSGGDNYYGILRHSSRFGIPSIISEHCYLDNTADSFIWGRSDYASILGNADANAIARYFGLKSSRTGADFSGCRRNYPGGVIYPDTTAPSVSGSVTAYDETTSTATIHVTGSDNESRILFATYSLDGVNYQPYVIYNNGADFTVQAAHGAHVYVVVANAHDMTEVADVMIP